MYPFKQLVIKVLVSLGLFAFLGTAAHAGPITVDYMIGYGSEYSSETMPGIYASVSIDPGWYFDDYSFTGMANTKGEVFPWGQGYRFFRFDLMDASDGGRGSSFLAFAEFQPTTRPGLYDRNPANLNMPATLTVYAHDFQGNYVSATVALCYTMEGTVVPEPASAFLLAMGVVIPAAGATLLRRKRSA